MRYRFPAIIPAILDRLIRVVLDRYYRIVSPLICRVWGVEAGEGVVFWGKAILRSHGGEITIGRSCRFNSSNRINLVGLNGPTIIETLKGGRIEIGDFSGFSSVVMSSMSSIKIGSNVMVGGNTRIYDNDFHAMESGIRGTSGEFARIRTSPIVIEDDVFIGANVIVLKGTRIGSRSIIAAGSVVFGLDIPPDSLVKGNPAKVIRTLVKYA